MTTPTDHRAELRDALRVLTEPPLLDRLIEAKEPSNGPGRPGGNIYKTPVALDVLVLLHDIDAAVGSGPDYARESRITRWGNYRLARYGDEDSELVDGATLATNWLSRARQIVYPEQQTLEPRPVPCPRCDQRTAMIWNEQYREHIQKSSLYLDLAVNVVFCRCCGAAWKQDVWPLLQRMLRATS